MSMWRWAKGTANSNRPCFTRYRFAAGGFGPSNLVPAHLRSPSVVDLVVQGAGAVSVLLNQGKGNFEDGVWTPLSSQGYCAATADFNGDGKPDVAVNTGQGVSILLGTGSAKAPFTAGQSLTLSNAGCLLAADLNGDHIPDLVVPQPDAVDAYLNNGDGTFTLKSSTPGSTGTGGVTVADFNRDGKLDFATTGNLQALGNGDGTFQTPVKLMANPPTNLFAGIAAGDLNGDGWPDLVLPSGPAVTVQIAGDLNGDVWPDLVLTSGPENSTIGIFVLINNQHGGFTQTVINTCPTLFAPGCNPSEIDRKSTRL